MPKGVLPGKVFVLTARHSAQICLLGVSLSAQVSKHSHRLTHLLQLKHTILMSPNALLPAILAIGCFPAQPVQLGTLTNYMGDA